MKDKIIELLKQYEDTHTQGVYRCDYDELADEVVKLFCQPDVSGRSELLLTFWDWYCKEDNVDNKYTANEMINAFLASNSH